MCAVELNLIFDLDFCLGLNKFFEGVFYDFFWSFFFDIQVFFSVEL